MGILKKKKHASKQAKQSTKARAPKLKDQRMTPISTTEEPQDMYQPPSPQSQDKEQYQSLYDKPWSQKQRRHHEPQQLPPPPCPDCNFGMKYIDKSQEWYCDKCKKFQPPPPLV